MHGAWCVMLMKRLGLNATADKMIVALRLTIKTEEDLRTYAEICGNLLGEIGHSDGVFSQCDTAKEDNGCSLHMTRCFWNLSVQQ